MDIKTLSLGFAVFCQPLMMYSKIHHLVVVIHTQGTAIESNYAAYQGFPYDIK